MKITRILAQKEREIIINREEQYKKISSCTKF